MIISLKNNIMEIKIDTLGAELKSILCSGTEFMWQGSDDSWKRTSPILFPIVGSLIDDNYTIDNKFYTLTPHGFARDMEFSVIEETPTLIMLGVKSTQETRDIYPFDFELQLGYKLEENTVKVIYKVFNLSKGNMAFSIGGHPGFNCPLDKSLNFSDYKLVFNKREKAYRRFKGDKVLTGKRQRFLESTNTIPLDYDVFSQGALIFDDLESTSISLESEKDNKKVIMDFTGFPYFGIWSWPKGNGNFVCLEPWFGIDSTIKDSFDWFSKEGLIHLEEGQSFETFYIISIFS